jgi:hypothetical protein
MSSVSTQLPDTTTLSSNHWLRNYRIPYATTGYSTQRLGNRPATFLNGFTTDEYGSATVVERYYNLRGGPYSR